MGDLSFEDILIASRRLRDAVVRTPIASSGALDALCGHRVYLKCENLQRAGAFKIRGALNTLRSLSVSERTRGVVAFSSGNHAQGVALAARVCDSHAIVLMPHDAPASKLAATRAYGAEVRFYDRQVEDREVLARTLVAQSGRTLVPPYDDPRIIAGQGTATLEFMQDSAGLDALLAPIGGGGLMAGAAIAARACLPAIKLYGVEPEVANDTWLSLRAGWPVTIAPPATLADGLRVTRPGALTFPLLRAHVDDVLLVTEEEIKTALRWLALRMKLVVEPSGAVALAALMAGKLPLSAGARVGVVLSGGNVDPTILCELLQ